MPILGGDDEARHSVLRRKTHTRTYVTVHVWNYDVPGVRHSRTGTLTSSGTLCSPLDARHSMRGRFPPAAQAGCKGGF